MLTGVNRRVQGLRWEGSEMVQIASRLRFIWENFWTPPKNVNIYEKKSSRFQKIRTKVQV